MRQIALEIRTARRSSNGTNAGRETAMVRRTEFIPFSSSDAGQERNEFRSTSPRLLHPIDGLLVQHDAANGRRLTAVRVDVNDHTAQARVVLRHIEGRGHEGDG